MISSRVQNSSDFLYSWNGNKANYSGVFRAEFMFFLTTFWLGWCHTFGVSVALVLSSQSWKFGQIRMSCCLIISLILPNNHPCITCMLLINVSHIFIMLVHMSLFSGCISFSKARVLHVYFQPWKRFNTFCQSESMTLSRDQANYGFCMSVAMKSWFYSVIYEACRTVSPTLSSN